jgi:hypothetical protein
MWLLHRRASFVKKLCWSFVLLVPLFGWLACGGLFQIPGETDIPCAVNSDAFYGGSH